MPVAGRFGKGLRVGAAMPAFVHRVVGFARVGIHQHRFVAGGAGRGHQLGDKARRGAVHPHRHHLRAVGQRRHRLGQGLALAGVRAIAAAEADPGLRLRKLRAQQFSQHARLLQAGQGFAGQHIRPGRQQRRQARAMKITQRGVVHAIVADVFRAIGAHGAKRPHRRRHQGARAHAVQWRIGRPERIARLTRQLHRQLQAGGGLLGAQTAPGKAFIAGLITGGGGHIGASGKIIVVHGANQLRVVQQHARRPQRIAQIAAAPLQLGGQGAIENQQGKVLQGLA